MIKDRAIVLYGSVARGDDDAWSDLDILVLGSDPHLPNDIKAASAERRRPVSVSHYTWKEFRLMHLSGSLFLHHLAAEAKPLRFEGLGRRKYLAGIRSLPRYRRADRDLRDFKQGLCDARHGLLIGSSPIFELAVLGGIARHASVLACYLRGEPDFGRSSIQQGTALVGVPELADCLTRAHRFCLFERGQCPKPGEATGEEVFAAVDACELFLNSIEPFANADNN